MAITECAVEGCTRQARTRTASWCGLHYQRWYETGDVGPPLPLEQLYGKAHPRWSDDRLTYDGVHLRLRRSKGKASQYPCVDCGKPAENWAYDYNDPNELMDNKRNCVYSADPDRYEPKCRSCHKKGDFAVAKTRKVTTP